MKKHYKIWHKYPEYQAGNGISSYGRYINSLMSDFYVDESRANVVHIELGYSTNDEFWFALKCALKKYPYIVTLHDPPAVIGKPFQRFIQSNKLFLKATRKALDETFRTLLVNYVIKNTKAVIVLNRQAVATLPKKAKIFFIPHAIINKTTEVKKKTNMANKINILFFGNISQRKGLDVLLRALDAIDDKASFSLRIAGKRDGDKKYQNTLDDLIKTAQYETAEMGRVSDETLTQEIVNADIVVLPYRYDGIVHASGPLIQSMASSKVVIATNIPVFRDTITNMKNGLLVKEGDPELLSGAIGKLINDSTMRNKIGREAKKYIIQNHSDKIVRESLLKIYRSII